jgi:Ni,Fe-hydrogenase I large subunit
MYKGFGARWTDDGGDPVEPGETTLVVVWHVVRSFDPCVTSTVHRGGS